MARPGRWHVAGAAGQPTVTGPGNHDRAGPGAGLGLGLGLGLGKSSLSLPVQQLRVAAQPGVL